MLAACDPAQPYGAALAWPETPGRPSRGAGAFVVLAEGSPLAFLERGGRSLVLFERSAEDLSWLRALASLVTSGQLKTIELQRVNGEPIAEHPHIEAAALQHGFRPGYRGPILRS